MFKGKGCGTLLFVWIAVSMLYSILTGSMTWLWFAIDAVLLYFAIGWMLGTGDDDDDDGGILA